MSFSNVLNQNYTGLNFGAVGVPVLSGEGDQGGTPSSFPWFAHRFTAGSVGQVTLSASHVANPDIATLSDAIYRDANDDGRIDAGDPAVTGPIAVCAGIFPGSCSRARRGRSSSAWSSIRSRHPACLVLHTASCCRNNTAEPTANWFISLGRLTG